MIENKTLKLISLITALAASSLHAQFKIASYQPNPEGADPSTQNIQIVGPPNTQFSGWILSIESDESPSMGVIERGNEISGTTNNYGYATVSIDDLENPSHTIVLAENFTGEIGITDIDLDNDGEADNLNDLGSIYDAIGVPDSTADETIVYGEDLGGENISYHTNEPSLVFRDTSGKLFFIDTDNILYKNGEIVEQEAFSSNPYSFNIGNPLPTFSGVLSNSTFNITNNNHIISPNPIVNNSFSILSDTSNELKFEVYDLLGTTVYNGVTTTNQIVSLPYINSGIYYVRITSNEGISETKKIILQ